MPAMDRDNWVVQPWSFGGLLGSTVNRWRALLSKKGGGLVGTARPGEQLATYVRRGDGNVRLCQSGIGRIDFCIEFDRQSQASAISQR